MIQLFCKIFLLSPAALPAIPPVKDEELEAKGVNLHTRLEADAEISVVHFVLFGARV